METIHHIVLIRHSLRIKEKLPSAYFQWRVGLMEKTILPCLAGQTCKQFKIAILLDKDTPDVEIETLKLRLQQFPNLTFVKSHGGVVHADVLKAIPAKNASLLAMTRVDSDDFVSIDFIEAIQNKINTLGMLKRIIIDNETFAHMLITGNEVRFCPQVLKTLSQFITTVEPWNNYFPNGGTQGVLTSPHPEMNRFFPVEKITGPIKTIWLIHGDEQASIKIYNLPYFKKVKNNLSKTTENIKNWRCLFNENQEHGFACDIDAVITYLKNHYQY